MAADLILLVVPDTAFRRSLEFALEADGFAVDSHAGTEPAFASPSAAAAACAIVDDAAVTDWSPASLQFLRFGRPVLILAGPFREVPELRRVSVVTKPFLGAPLIDAVRQATSGAA
ncbi:hypothetical protein [Mesorhizobium marinum]|uniref:Transcriptional regulator n=1 Tax=Mesorhizobium marinum TaxID=3228790 RepID=A0ABV3QUI7_9HYPH